MKNYSKHTATIAALGIVAAAIPFMVLANADGMTPPPTRARNIETNRDYRNTVMRASATLATSSRPVVREAMSGEVHAEAVRVEAPKAMKKIIGPKWLAATSTPLGERLNASTLMQLQQTAKKFASSTGPEGHETWKKARLDIFTWMQSHLIAETQKSLSNLKSLRARIADRIQTASAAGRDMTDAARLLAIADTKLSAADSALQDLSSLAPTILASSTDSRIDPSTEVDLSKPRDIGNAAIKAVLDAKKALNDVVVSIAHSMGYTTPEAATSTQQ